MKTFVGIDLGTTNSAVCTYDGVQTRVWKSPEQNDVTPSVIYLDKRGNKYVGKRAYDAAPWSPDNAASLFKRLMGTSTPIKLPALDLTKTPEECSAEILKAVFGYLPEEARDDPETGTVITVPAAFNQMQKDATMHAARLAGIGKVALMQEPVAAVMSVMRTRRNDGMFLIYDLGGGTLDIALADSIGGRVSLLGHGGIAQCGGRDFDRTLFDNVVRSWLEKNFDLPENFVADPAYKTLLRLAVWATEKAKIELSSAESARISLSESETRTRDRSGVEIYLDVELRRSVFDELVAERVRDSVNAARETLSHAGVSPHDVERVVFIGGPTNYKPLRDMVCFELGISGALDVNPMTAVAEGASLFAESLDWSLESRPRKSSRGQLSSAVAPITFSYTSRTPETQAKLVCQVTGDIPSGLEFQVDSVDTGWTSGRLPVAAGASLSLSLSGPGENSFSVRVFDSDGAPVRLEQDSIRITRSAATVEAIPASHSVGIEVLDRLNGTSTLDYLVRAGEQLPKKGKKIFRAAESLKAGGSGELRLKLWEGDIEDRVTDNRPIGVLKVTGADFEEGVIPIGAELECEYEILDSGNIRLEVSVPSVRGLVHSGKNLYSRQEGQLDYTTAARRVQEDGQETLERVEELSAAIDDPKLAEARQKLASAVMLDPAETETEKTQEADSKVLEAKRLLAQVAKSHRPAFRRVQLEQTTQFFEDALRELARPTEISTYESLVSSAQRQIDRADGAFERQMEELHSLNYRILIRQDWYVLQRFEALAASPHRFADQREFTRLVADGKRLVAAGDVSALREVYWHLCDLLVGGHELEARLESANILRG